MEKLGMVYEKSEVHYGDETGVAEDPGGKIGYILRDEREASVMATFGLRLEHTLSDPSDDGWQSVSDAARTALAVLAG